MEKIELTPAELALARDEEYDPTQDAELAEEQDEQLEEDFVEEDSDVEPEEEAPVEDQLPEKWYDEEALKYAKSYNLSESDLDSFSNFDELQRFGEMTDRRIANSGFQQYQQQPPREQEEVEQPEEESANQFELYDPQHLIDENYDETTVNLGKALRETQEMLNRVMPLAEEAERTRALEVQEQQATFAKTFHKTLDNFDAGLFGTVFDATESVGEISNPHDENRRAVWNAAEKIIQATPVENDSLDDKTLIKRAVGIAFGGVKERGSASRSVTAAAKQSRKRRPTSSNRRMSQGPRTDVSTSQSDDVQRIAESPAVQKMWSQFQRDNGQM